MNQKAQSEYTTTGYTIDRWKLAIGTGTASVKPGSDGISLDIKDSGTSLTYLQQTVPCNLAGQTLTFSALIPEITEGKIWFDFTDVHWGASGGFRQLKSCSTPGLFSYTIEVPAGCTADIIVNMGAHNNNNNVAISAKILAVKLEIGPVQTLAHKEGDKWVLNEVPSYAEQLARCQRYQLNLFDPTNTGQSYVFQGIATTGTNIYGICPTPVTLAKQPTIVTDCSANVMYSTFGLNANKYQAIADVSALSVFGKMEHGVILVATGSNFVAGNPYMIYIAATNTHQCLLDANL